MLMRKIAKFYLIFWCGNFVEMHGFGRASDKSPGFLQNSHTRKSGKVSVFSAVCSKERGRVSKKVHQNVIMAKLLRQVEAGHRMGLPNVIMQISIMHKKGRWVVMFRMPVDVGVVHGCGWMDKFLEDVISILSLKPFFKQLVYVSVYWKPRLLFWWLVCV